MAWRGALSDDLVAAQILKYAGRVRFEPEALAPTVIDHRWPDLLAFVHRQFAMGRRYAPLFWASATVAAVVHQGVFWMGLALLPMAAIGGGWPVWAALASVSLYALQVARARFRQDAARQLLPAYAARLAEAPSVRFVAGPAGRLVGRLGFDQRLVELADPLARDSLSRCLPMDGLSCSSRRWLRPCRTAHLRGRHGRVA